jgi:hypothetical protein
MQRTEEFAFAQIRCMDIRFANSFEAWSGRAFVTLSFDFVSFWFGQCEFQVHEMFIEEIAN